ITTSFGPGTGVSTSSQVRGAPNARSSAAFMTRLLGADDQNPMVGRISVLAAMRLAVNPS
ncbi:MAG: hypothetical protein MK364_20905, partial [Pirellulales bacterium]|nr:hypothetical protein [Pirellulales bacterium]